MVNISTSLLVADNSGAIRARCIGITGSKKVARVGDIVVCSVLRTVNWDPSNESSAPVINKKGSVHRGVIIRTKKAIRRGGYSLFSGDNAVVLLNDNIEIVGTRVRGAVFKEAHNFVLSRIGNKSILI